MLLKTISIIYKTVRLGINEFQSRLGHPLIPNYFQPSLVPSFANIPNNISERGENDLVSLLNEYILRAVPKSKVSPSRKRQKHGRYIPERINWYVCQRCGEPKRPHRICTSHLDICAMRDEDWIALQKSKEAEKTESS